MERVRIGVTCIAKPRALPENSANHDSSRQQNPPAADRGGILQLAYFAFTFARVAFFAAGLADDFLAGVLEQLPPQQDDEDIFFAGMDTSW